MMAGVSWIEPESIWWFGVRGWVVAQVTVATERVGAPVAAQVEAQRFGPRDRPFVFVAPAIVAHDKESHRRFVQDRAVLILEPVVEPSACREPARTTSSDSNRAMHA